MSLFSGPPKAFWQASGLSVLLNVLLCSSLSAPGLSCLGGGLGAYVLLRFSGDWSLKPSSQLLFLWFTSLLSALLVALASTILALGFFNSPFLPKDNWLRLEALDQLLLHSRSWRAYFFIFNFVLTATFNWVAAWAVFKLKRGKKLSEKEFIEALKPDELSRYTE